MQGTCVATQEDCEEEAPPQGDFPMMGCPNNNPVCCMASGGGPPA